MTSANAAKGKGFERDVFRFLAERFGRDVRRPHQEGFKDTGDIHLSPVAIQAKNWSDTTAALNEGLKGAETQAIHAGEKYGVVVIKKRGSGVGEARVAMSLRTFRSLIGRLLQAERLLQRYAPEAYHETHVPNLTAES